jgi:predicted Rossmann fold flavoprotein
MNEQAMRELIAKEYDEIKRKKISNIKLFALPSRLWIHLLDKCEINPEINWADLKKEKLNRLINTICNDEYQVKGKTTFREEFVTCGGVRLADVNFNTMESTICRGIYFTGEVLDIDGVTGGFNFQSAWTTGFIAGKLLS